MNIVVVTARTHSERLAKKPLVDVAGRPNILRVLDRLKLCKTLDKVLVSTTDSDDDAGLVALLQHEGVSFSISPEGDVLAALVLAGVAAIGEQRYRGTHYILRMTTDMPFFSWNLIDLGFQFVRQYRADSGRVWGMPDRMVPIYGSAEFPVSFEALVKMNQGLAPEDSSRQHGPADIDAHRLRYGVAYASPPKEYCEMFYRPYRLELDTPQDLQLIEKVYEILGEAPSLEEVVGLLSANPDISMLNAGISERTGPLSSYSAEQRAEWKFQQVQNTFQWMGDWSFLRNKTIPVNAQPVYCERNTCRIGFLKNGRLITLDGSEIVAGKIACSCGAGRSWHKERP